MMDADQIITKLKTTPQACTFVDCIREELKQMNDADCDFLMLELRRQIDNPENRPIYDLLQKILS